MSEKHLEELKKICLICGCHTSQAINIYEPRAGPNIVELIQAKFKFQPVNEDKYLCFSCNNWLINWHSLQAINTEANSQSGKSRSRINNSIPEEETEDVSEMRSEQQPHHPHSSSRKRNGFYFCRRTSVGWRRIRKMRRKRVHPCSVCGRPIQRRAKMSFEATAKFPSKCRNCRRILKWRAKYSKALVREERRKLREIKASKLDESGELHFWTNLVNRQRQRPLVDGKVVAMLRRLGTTLTRESDCSFGSAITTAAAEGPASVPEKRTLDDDEILIDFNTAITEVLPLDRVRYPMTPEPEQDVDEETSHLWPPGREQLSLEALYSRIPKCVTVSVVSAGSH